MPSTGSLRPQTIETDRSTQRNGDGYELSGIAENKYISSQGKSPVKAVLVFAGLFRVELCSIIQNFVASPEHRHCSTPDLHAAEENLHSPCLFALNSQDTPAGFHSCKSVFFRNGTSPLPRCRSPPFLTFAQNKCSEMEEMKLYKRYFRKKDPTCRPEDIEWIEMSGKEFYRFITSPEAENHHFIDIDRKSVV